MNTKQFGNHIEHISDRLMKQLKNLEPGLINKLSLTPFTQLINQLDYQLYKLYVHGV